MDVYSVLQHELLTDPLQLGYAGKSAQDVADLLNNTPRPRLKPGAFLDERGIIALLGVAAGEAALQGLEAAAPTNKTLARVLRWLQGVGLARAGVDFGDQETQDILDTLSASGVFTADTVAKLKAFGTEPRSRALELVGIPVSEADIAVITGG